VFGRRTGRDFFVTSEKPIFIERQTIRMNGKKVEMIGKETRGYSGLGCRLLG
jgi:hypothetical protein